MQQKRQRVVIGIACLVWLVSISLGTGGCAAGVTESTPAGQSLHDDGLPTEGLSREDIQAISLDITTESFTYSKTAGIMINSTSSEQIGGYKILQDEPTAQDVENIQNSQDYNGRFVSNEPDTYQFHVEHILNDAGEAIDSKFYMEKSEGDTAVWRTYLPFWLGEYYEVDDGVIAFGHETTYASGKAETDGWIVKLDSNGTVLWINQLENGFDMEYPEDILVNSDGSYTLFSRGDKRCLCVSRYSSDGELMQYAETDLGSHSIGHAASYGDGYLLQIYTSEQDELARVIQVDPEGNVIGGFSYQDAQNRYAIMDMTVWGGKVYVSAYATPKLGEEERTYGGRTEIARILEYAFSQDADIPSEELTPVVRKNYTAVLLVCDPNDHGKIQVFYTVPGALGADLTVAENGQLIWEAESITTTFYSPGTSSFTIGGICCVCQYAFDDSGILIGCEKTDALTNYAR